MKTFYSLNDFRNSSVSNKNYILTIGVFDGVHLGHKKIIEVLKKKAKKNRASTLLLTFEPHPSKVLSSTRKSAPLLISLKHRLNLLKEEGLDCVIVLRFTKAFSRMSPETFIGKVMRSVHVKAVVIGPDFSFGRHKSGSEDELKKLSHDYGYSIHTVKPALYAGEIVSSTRIRTLISEGKLKKASRLLSRPVSVLGTVIKGRSIGRIMGFPTANIDPHNEALPPSGVYAVRIKLDDKKFNGVLNIGERPTFKKYHPDEINPSIEAHIFDFNRMIYGKDLEIEFVRKIREEREFGDENKLIRQIMKDSARANAILR